jgi:hypothetical protein
LVEELMGLIEIFFKSCQFIEETEPVRHSIRRRPGLHERGFFLKIWGPLF